MLDFVTLGMFIIDEIHFKSPKAPEVDILGGAGTWSVIGARLSRPAPSSRLISWIIHRGSDFPEKLLQQIEGWQTSCNFIDTPERLTTRGWNSYGDDEARAFKYLTPKLRIDETQLSDEQVGARCFHLISTPTRCIDLVRDVMKRRQALGLPETHRPYFVWEPVPDACKVAELESALEALRHVDVVSPNHQELAAFFGVSARTERPTNDDKTLADCCRQMLRNGFGQGRGAIVVRCGERGCLWMTSKDDNARVLPAWHQRGLDEDDPRSSFHVVDPTGAGNAFLGGFCTGILDDSDRSHELSEAVMQGLVAASFAIEQVGLPKLTHVAGEELWNGDSVVRRLEVLKRAVSC